MRPETFGSFRFVNNFFIPKECFVCFNVLLQSLRCTTLPPGQHGGIGQHVGGGGGQHVGGGGGQHDGRKGPGGGGGMGLLQGGLQQQGPHLLANKVPLSCSAFFSVQSFD